MDIDKINPELLRLIGELRVIYLRHDITQSQYMEVEEFIINNFKPKEENNR